MARTTQVQLRVTPEEKAQWKACADSLGYSLSEWIVKIALQAARDQRQIAVAPKPPLGTSPTGRTSQVTEKKAVKKGNPLLQY